MARDQASDRKMLTGREASGSVSVVRRRRSFGSPPYVGILQSVRLRHL